MNHLQGFFAASVFYTLEKDGEIFALVSFRKMKNNKFELSRFCVKMGESISGALKRLYYSEKRRTVSSSSFIYLN